MNALHIIITNQARGSLCYLPVCTFCPSGSGCSGRTDRTVAKGTATGRTRTQWQSLVAEARLTQVAREAASQTLGQEVPLATRCRLAFAEPSPAKPGFGLGLAGAAVCAGNGDRMWRIPSELRLGWSCGAKLTVEGGAS